MMVTMTRHSRMTDIMTQAARHTPVSTVITSSNLTTAIKSTKGRKIANNDLTILEKNCCLGDKADHFLQEEFSILPQTFPDVLFQPIILLMEHCCRRHINPVTVDTVDEVDKRMLVMKDLNVQYFPCKLCGAKFPSYYFVHKHKKMWHAAQMEQEEANVRDAPNQDIK